MDDRQRQRPARSLGLPLSLGAHALFGLLLLLFLPVPKQKIPEPEQGIDVEIVMPEQAPAAPVPVPAPVPGASVRTAPKSSALSPLQPPASAVNEDFVPRIQPAPPSPTASPEPSAAAPRGRIKATTLLSAKTLADPRSWQARAALKQLSGADRLEQICNLEAMEQVRSWNADYRPDAVVAYAMAETKPSGRTVDAPGAAIRSKGHWYGISYTCNMAATAEEVISFEFEMGAEIPEDQWAEHSLFAGTSVD